MHLTIIIVLSIFVLIITGSVLTPYTPMFCKTKLGFVPVIQTMILDLDENTDKDLKTCLLKYVNYDNSLLLISGNQTKTRGTSDRYSTSDNPNIVIMTKQITSAVLDIISAKGVLKSHRSVLFIIITDDKTFKCNNGELETNDFQNLEVFMNQLWHKFRIAHVGATFPLNCLGKIAVYSGKQNTNQSLYDRTIKLVDIDDNVQLQPMFGEKRAALTEDYPLKAGIFENFPTTITECDKLHYYTRINLSITGGYCGLDALMMHNIITHFKFKVELVTDDKCSGYGHYSANNHYNITNSLGCIVRKNMDISFNSRFLLRYSRDQVNFLHFVDTDSLCAMVKQADVIPIWYYTANIYTSNMWLLIVTVNVVIGLFLWTSSLISNKINGNERKTLYFYIKDAFTLMMFGISNNNNDSRMIRGICLCSSFMFLAVYQGHINHVFTTLLRYDTIKTLDDLYETNLILYVTPSLKEIMKQLQKHSALDNMHQRNFIKRMTDFSNTDYTLDALLRTPRAAFLGRKKDRELDILRNFTESDNKKPLINIVQECFGTYYLSYISGSDFPFVEELTRFMERIREAGLADAYYTWTCNMLRVPSEMPKLRTEPRHFASIKMSHVRLAFMELVLFETVAIIVFFIELWRGRRARQRSLE